MISWIQKYFQKHFWLVFLAVLIAVGLPMIVVYSASGSGSGRDGTKVLEQPFFNVNLANAEQARRMFSDGELSAYLRAGYAGLQGGQVQQYSLQRVAGLALAEELHLPAPSPAEIARFVPTLRAFQNQQGQFDQSVYTRFADSLKAGGPFSIADVNRVLRDDARLEALTKLLGGPGYVLPTDVKQQLIQTDSVWTVQVASLDYATFAPAINPTEEALKKFREDHSGNYDVPARPRLGYVEFKAADFPPPTAPTESDLRAYYNANLSSFPAPVDADKKDAAVPAPTTDNFPKVRAQVEAAMRNIASQRLAMQAANDLTIALFEHKATIKANSPELASFLASQHRTVGALPPFAPNLPPADKPWLGEHAEAIARLNADRYFSDPLTSPDGVVVLLWQETLPPYKPLFSEVRDRVAADYRESEKRRLFIERGIALKAELQAAAKTPAGFAEKAAAEKLEVKSYTNFTLRQPPQDLPQPALATLGRLAAGQVSEMIGAAGKGLLVYAQEKKLPDVSPANPRYAEIQGQLMAFIANNNENTVLGELVEQELKKTSKTDIR
jgi:peptidyl-prolyl cis-trans isomerase D